MMKLQTATAGLKRRSGVRKVRKAEKKRTVGKLEEMDSNDGDAQENAEERNDEQWLPNNGCRKYNKRETCAFTPDKQSAGLRIIAI